MSALHCPDARRHLQAAGTTGIGLLLVLAPAAAVAGTPTPGPVTVHGAPLVHTFDLDVPHDAVTGLWHVTSSSPTPTSYDGVLVADDEVPSDLAHALVVQYGTVDRDGRVTAWHDAGTLAEPASYAATVPRPASVSSARPAAVPVRVSLPDPARLEARPGQRLAVEATFTVDYLTPAPTPATGGVLATTGGSTWLAAAAALLVLTGLTATRLAATRAAARRRAGA